MRSWPQESKQALRLLAAARYFLPEFLECPAEMESQYQSHLRQGEFQAALDTLAQIGEMHTDHENEVHFWKELYYAAQQLALPEQAARYQEQLRILVEMRQLQG